MISATGIVHITTESAFPKKRFIWAVLRKTDNVIRDILL